MKLNSKQRAVLIVGVIVFALAALFFVPYQVVAGKATYGMPSSSIFRPPPFDADYFRHHTPVVATGQYMLRLGVIAVIFGGLAFALKD